MRLHHSHGMFVTTHNDELPHLDIEYPTRFAGCIAALSLLIVAAMVIGVIALVIALPPAPWKVPFIAAGIVVLWFTGRQARR